MDCGSRDYRTSARMRRVAQATRSVTGATCAADRRGGARSPRGRAAVRPEPSDVASGTFARRGRLCFRDDRAARERRDGMETLRSSCTTCRPSASGRSSTCRSSASPSVSRSSPACRSASRSRRTSARPTSCSTSPRSIMTIPSIALFGVMIPVLSLIGQGIGYLPAVIAVLLYSQLPIIRNTYTAITQRRSGAARGGARHGHVAAAAAARRSRFRSRVPVIMAGVRIAVVINIGITAIADVHRRRRARHVHHPRHLADRLAAAHHRRAGASACSRSSPTTGLLWLQRRLTPRGHAHDAPCAPSRLEDAPHDPARER